jgi:3-oxo-5-alpha-steroid 4-dehydrogenase 1
MLQNFELLLLIWFAIGLIAFFILLKIPAPYGKFAKENWGPMIPSKIGWIVMEIISPLTLLYFYCNGNVEKSITSTIFISLWVAHYFNRSIIYPFRQNNPVKMPLLIAILAFLFNIANGFVNGAYFGSIQTYTSDYMLNWNFITGVCLFIIGAVINIKSDNILLSLRSTSGEYKIPNGFMYKYISFPNYFGEILEWVAFALMTWSLAGLSFMIWSMANLIPRAIAGHRWYKKTFDNYPSNRKAIIPFIL